MASLVWLMGMLSSSDSSDSVPLDWVGFLPRLLPLRLWSWLFRPREGCRDNASGFCRACLLNRTSWREAGDEGPGVRPRFSSSVLILRNMDRTSVEASDLVVVVGLDVEDDGVGLDVGGSFFDESPRR